MASAAPARGILLCPTPVDSASVHAAFLELAGDRPIHVWPDLPDPEQIGCIVAFRVPRGVFALLPNLRLIHGTGAGMNHMLVDPELPRHLPMARVVADAVTQGMAQHCLHAILRELREHRVYDRLQREKTWQRRVQIDAATWPVGIMGLGALGTGLAEHLVRLGFAVRGWSRSAKQVPGVESFAGPDRKHAFLSGCRAVVVLLPLTAETTGSLDAAALAAMPRGAVVIAAGRGGQVDEAALLAALDSGQIGHAHLDVMATEPLPPESPLWSHPDVTLTPHVAAAPNGVALARLVLENLDRLENGRELLFPVDPIRGY